MKAKDIITDAISAYKTGQNVSVVCNYKKAVKILKAFIALSETEIRGLELNDALWDGYGESWLISLENDGGVFCQKAINDRNDKPFQGDGYYIIDSKALNGRKPEDFCLGGSQIKVV